MRYLESIGLPDIVVFTEAHLRPASAPTIDHYKFQWEPRAPEKLRGGSQGGVAFAVSQSSQCIKRAHVAQVYANADVVWLQLSFSTSPVVVNIAGVYLPPEGGDRVCRGECALHLCPKSHVDEAIDYISLDIQRYSKDSTVIVAGDFNARAQLLNSPRWLAIQQSIIVPNSLTLINLKSLDGNLLPTRLDPQTHSETVLDLVMWSGGDTVCVLDRDAGVSDHYPMQCHFQLPCYPTPSPDASASKRYGLESRIATHLRGSHKTVTPPPREGKQRMFDAITQRWHTEIGTTPSVGDVERWLMQTAEQCGLVEKRDKLPVAMKHAAKLQRRIDQLRMEYHFALCDKASQRRLDGISHVLQLAISARASSLSDRRHCQRERRTAKRRRAKAVCDDLDSPWLKRDPFTFARRARQHEQGSLHFRGSRNHTPLPVLQDTLHQLELDLAAKYSRDFDATLVQRWQCTLDEDIASGRDVDTQFVPSTDDVAAALSRMKAGADAIGLPVPVLKSIVGTPAFDTVVQLIQSIWRTGEVPDTFQLARVHLIHKSGPHHLLASHRTIGICSAMSRLLQTTVEAKLMREVEHKICAAQYGFMRRKATELCVFVSETATFCARADGATVDAVMLDIKGAFPTTRHNHIHAAMRAYNVSVGIRRMLISWYARQRLFLQLGRLISNEVSQWLGVTEGTVFSPLVYVIVIDPSLHRTHTMYLWANLRFNTRIGLSVLGICLVLLFYADDGKVFGPNPVAVQHVLDVIGEEFGDRLDFEFNAAVTKSAWIRLLPFNKSDRIAARRQPPALYTLCDKVLPQTSQYRYLGVHEHEQGRAKSTSLHNAKQRPICAIIQRQAASSDMAALPLIHCRGIYLTYWWPRVMYAVGLVQSSVPQQLAVMESRVLRYFTSAWQHPVVVLRSLFGISTQQTRFDLDRVRLFFRLLRQPPGGLERVCLCLLVLQYHRDHNRQSWWQRTLDMFTTMDTVSQQPGVIDRMHSVTTQHPWTCWVDWATRCALNSDGAMTEELDVLYPICRTVMLDVECHRRQQDILTCYDSLTEVADLLDTPNVAPFTCLSRGRTTTTRINLWGGRRTLFGYQFFHVAACPWCMTPGAFTVGHIMRDCTRLENDRRIAFSEAAAFLRSSGVKVVSGVDENRGQWYRLMVGASVDNSVFSLQLSTSTHFARPPTQPATAHLRKHLKLYRGVIHKLDTFFLRVVDCTAAQLELWRYVVMYTPPRGVRLPRVNHSLVPRIAVPVCNQAAEAAVEYEFEFETPGLEQYVDWYNPGAINAYTCAGDATSDEDGNGNVATFA